MAFLLSPKTGGGVTYALNSDPYEVSINGAPAQIYATDSPTTVKPGDVISGNGRITAHYFATFPPGRGDSPMYSATGNNGYTVEDVTGAVGINVQVRES